MKKSVLFVAAALVAGMSFTSCKKCVTCSYTPTGGAKVSQEFCSTSSTERDTFKAAQEIAASFAGTTATCE
jgi:hypothetical protein